MSRARRSPLIGLGAALAAACSAPPPSGQLDGRAEDVLYPNVRVDFEGGTRAYRDGGWGGLDRQPVLGFTLTQEPPWWILGLEGGLFWSGASGDLQGLADVDVDSWEGSAGVMKTVPLIDRRLIVELGAGYALCYAHLEADGGSSLVADDEAWWSAAYARAALLLRLGDDAWVGLAGRSLRGGGVSLGGVGLDGDYDQIAFVLAARW